MSPTHLLIGCGRSKLDHPAPARDLYTGPLFRAARGYAESSGLPWAVLSARYGVVQPEQVIESYEYRLAGRAAAVWSDHVSEFRLACQLQEWAGLGPWAVEVHAGAVYVRWLRGVVAQLHQGQIILAEDGDPRRRVLAPLAGLQVGERLSWYRQRKAAA